MSSTAATTCRRRTRGRTCGPATDGLLLLELDLYTDRLVITAATGTPRTRVLLNPKSPNLKSLNLFVSYARGYCFHAAAFKTAALGPGGLVELRREPDNAHDPNALQMLAPGAKTPFAYVQSGKVRAVACLIDAGVDLAGVSMRGPPPGETTTTRSSCSVRGSPWRSCPSFCTGAWVGANALRKEPWVAPEV